VAPSSRTRLQWKSKASNPMKNIAFSISIKRGDHGDGARDLFFRSRIT
jgi:hypothetical protein